MIESVMSNDILRLQREQALLISTKNGIEDDFQQNNNAENDSSQGNIVDVISARKRTHQIAT